MVAILRALIAAIIMITPSGPSARAGEVRAAVASNFAGAAKAIAARFEAETGYTVTLAFGSTGMHYAQIRNGAPFDVFLAADAARPGLLESEGIAKPESRFTYAVGKLVLWSPDAAAVDTAGAVLGRGGFRHLAVANPELAPYGRAAEQVLHALGLWDALAERIVRGENIAQTLQFVESGNAELGFVAYSQIRATGAPVAGSFWLVPASLYDPIEQQAVLLTNNGAAREFMRFLRGDEARSTIRSFGYDTP